MIFGYNIAARMIAAIAGMILVIGLLSFGASQCSKRQNQAAQSRVDKAQAGAAEASGADAIATVSNRAASAAASEDLTRESGADIRAAPGADQRANSGVDLAGRKALCKRAAYKDDPKCAMFR